MTWASVRVAGLCGVLVSVAMAPVGAQSRIASQVAPAEAALGWTFAGSPVFSVAFSGDGNRLTGGGADGTVRVWDAVSGVLVLTITVGRPVFSVAYSADGRWIAGGRDDGKVQVWDAQSGDSVRTLTGHSGGVSAVAYSGDGRWLASGSADGTVRVWDNTSGTAVRTLTGHSGAVLSVAYSGVGKWLASGGVDGTVVVWDAASGATERTLLVGSPVRSVAYSGDGRWLLSGSDDGTVRVWDPAIGALVRTFPVGRRARSVAFSGNGRWLASGSADGTVRLIEGPRNMIAFARRPELARQYAPQDEFETDAQYRARIVAADMLRDQVLAELSLEEIAQAAAARVEAERRSAEKESRIIASRRTVTIAYPVTLERYDANASQYPVQVAGVTARIAMPAEEARLLSQNRDRIVVEATEQLAEDLLTTNRVNLQLIHPVTGKRYPVGPQVAIQETARRVAVIAPAALSVLEPRFTDTDGDNLLGAGERAVLEFRLRNTGQGPAQGVRVIGTSDAPIDGLNATLGTVAAGETRAVSLTLVGRNDVKDTTVTLRLEVKEINGFDAPPLEVRVRTRAFRPPVLQVADVGVEDADGRAEIRSGRVVTLTIRVRNDGEGNAEGVIAEIAAGANVLLVDSTDNRRVTRHVGDLAPGAHRDVTVQAFANAQAGRTFPVTVTLRERTSRFTAAARDLGLTQQATLRSVAQLDVAARESASATGAAATSPALVSDLLPIPMARKRNRHAIAVIIGNRSYRNAPGVAFAANDAAVMRQYAEQALGVEPGNILELNDATGTELNATFGVRGNPNGRLRDLVTADSSEVFVFYSGHGAPDPRAQKAYLMPVDADANRLDLTAYSVDVLYENLAALGAKHVTVVLDACFSGATGGGEMLITAASPIGIQVNDPSARFAAGSRATIIAAAQGQELANWYPERRHGLLTYYFLKGLQGSADADGDGTVTVGEMRAWLTDPTSGVPYESRRLFGMNRQQTPQVWGSSERRIR